MGAVAPVVWPPPPPILRRTGGARTAHGPIQRTNDAKKKVS